MMRKPTPREILKRLRSVDTNVREFPETVSLVGVPADGFGPDAEEPVEDDDLDGDGRLLPRLETNIRTGETTLYIDGEKVDTSSTDCPECSEDGCSNPRCAGLSTCEKCAGMPEQDWREGVE